MIRPRTREYRCTTGREPPIIACRVPERKAAIDPGIDDQPRKDGGFFLEPPLVETEVEMAAGWFFRRSVVVDQMELDLWLYAVATSRPGGGPALSPVSAHQAISRMKDFPRPLSPVKMLSRSENSRSKLGAGPSRRGPEVSQHGTTPFSRGSLTGGDSSLTKRRHPPSGDFTRRSAAISTRIGSRPPDQSSSR